jgi:hypothetical protein
VLSLIVSVVIISIIIPAITIAAATIIAGPPSATTTHAIIVVPARLVIVVTAVTAAALLLPVIAGTATAHDIIIGGIPLLPLRTLWIITWVILSTKIGCICLLVPIADIAIVVNNPITTTASHAVRRLLLPAI